MTGGPGKEHRTNKPPPTRRVQKRSKGITIYPTNSQNPFWHPSWLSNACTTRKDSESEGSAKDNPETNPITIRPETASHVAQQFSWVPLPYCSPPRHPFPKKYIALSAHGSPQSINFWVLDKSPLSSSGRGSLFRQQFDLFAVQRTLKSLLQHHNSKTSVLWHSAFFMVQISHPYMTTGKTIALSIK